jgi:hypothetical protein
MIIEIASYFIQRELVLEELCNLYLISTLAQVIIEKKAVY